jgi:type IV pilus assembly protein PilV
MNRVNQAAHKGIRPAPAHRRRGQAPGRHRGVGMIEVLTAMVIIAIALLGISRAQIAMLRQNQSALHRSQASILAYDVIDRMRVDREGALAGDYDRVLGAARPGAATVAGAAMNQWLDTLAATLPAGDGGIARNGDAVIVTVRWDDSRGQLAPLTFTTAVEL